MATEPTKASDMTTCDSTVETWWVFYIPGEGTEMVQGGTANSTVYTW